MKVNLAKSAGFCAGVSLAVKKALQAAQQNTSVFMLGDIVHNEIVVDKISEVGVLVVDKIDNIPAGATLLIRAHGASPQVFKKARERKLNIIDATCPMVADIHRAIIDLSNQGYPVAVIGDRGHDEVEGIIAQVPKAIVLDGMDDIKKVARNFQKLGVVVQSTQDIDYVASICEELKGNIKDLKFVNTICQPTKKHQEDIKTMPKQNDVMIIIGSEKSANTKRLVDISKKINPRTYRVMTDQDLQAEWFEGAKSVGVTAGASTPDETIEEVVNSLENDF